MAAQGPAAASSTMEPPKKRRRLSQEAYGSITERKTQDVETSLEVDHMILDYLLSQAIDACFANPHTRLGDEVSSVERALLQIDEFSALFKRRYPKYKLDEEIRFRQKLLQLVALFTQRLTRNSTTIDKSTLKRLREENGARARRWIGDASRIPSAAFNVDALEHELPLPEGELDMHRAHVLQELGAPTEDHAYDDDFYGTTACTSLLDLLPMFMSLSAAFHEMLEKMSSPSKQWMGLAAEWMLHACMEQYLVFGSNGSDAMDEAFAWGYKRATSDSGKHQEDDFVNGMFGENGAETPSWTVIRRAALQELAQSVHSAERRLLDLVSHHPIEQFQHSVGQFLRDIHQFSPKPVLAQLESGQLEGMSKEETSRFIEDCGLNLHSLFGR